MSLSAGTRLGPYEVIAPIGRGGMGEVYRATDTNLKRSVAIKVLPDDVAADRDRLGRAQVHGEGYRTWMLLSAEVAAQCVRLRRSR